jgi:tyrosyl-tRNA synthetase
MTSPYKFYQFWINVDDRDVEGYLKLFTLKPKEAIAATMARHQKEPAARVAQAALAADVTTLAHGADAAASAAAVAGILFGDFDPRRADPKVFEVLAQEIPTTPVARGALTLVDAVVQAGLAKSKSEARRAIEQGGIYVNQQRADGITDADWLAGGSLLLRKGKKDYALLKAQ